MSNLRVNTFSPSGGGTARNLRGVAAAWANLDGIGTIALRDSENVSSVVDNGTGNYTFNWTNSFSAGTYAPMISAARFGAASSDNQSEAFSNVAGSSVGAYFAAPVATFADPVTLTVSAQGDLA